MYGRVCAQPQSRLTFFSVIHLVQHDTTHVTYSSCLILVIHACLLLRYPHHSHVQQLCVEQATSNVANFCNYSSRGTFVEHQLAGNYRHEPII